jgi:cell division protein FtsB
VSSISIGISQLRWKIKNLYARQKTITDEIESLECELAELLEKEEQEKRGWVDSNEDRRGW